MFLVMVLREVLAAVVFLTEIHFSSISF